MGCRWCYWWGWKVEWGGNGLHILKVTLGTIFLEETVTLPQLLAQTRHYKILCDRFHAPQKFYPPPCCPRIRMLGSLSEVAFPISELRPPCRRPP